MHYKWLKDMQKRIRISDSWGILARPILNCWLFRFDHLLLDNLDNSVTRISFPFWQLGHSNALLSTAGSVFQPLTLSTTTN
jgi:hypothetical protein